MLTAVQGHYDGNQIILDENLSLINGQKVILAVFENNANLKAANDSKYRIQAPDESEWQLFMQGINGFTEDFMANGRESEIPSVREIL